MALIDLALLLVLIGQRTDTALQTPWLGLSPGFFLQFAFSSALLIHSLVIASNSPVIPSQVEGSRRIAGLLPKARNDDLLWFAILIHSSLIYGVALIVFRYGYGYDPIIHQAAEESIVKNGLASIQSPLYFGQYAVVTILHWLTTIPVRLIDRVLLPTLSAFSVPILTYYGLTRAHTVAPAKARMLSVLVPLLALPALTFTTPYNLTVLFTLWWIFLLPLLSYRHPEPSRGISVTPHSLIVLLIAFVAAITHPLLGVPLVIATIVAVVGCRFSVIPSPSSVIPSKAEGSRTIDHQSLITKLLIYSITTTLIATSIITMFGVYRLSHHEAFFPSTSFWSAIPPLASTLFFRVSWGESPWHLVVLYAISWLMPVLIVAVGAWQLFKIPKLSFLSLSGREKLSFGSAQSLASASFNAHWYRLTILSLAAGLLLAVPFVYTASDIPGILESDQAEFARRLLLVIPIFFLPSFLVAISARISSNHFESLISSFRAMVRQAHHDNVLLSSRAKPRDLARSPSHNYQFPITVYLLTAILLTTLWYSTYPQVNAAISRTGYNVSAADLAAVRVIEQDARGEPYIVLSDRLLAAVALRELGFFTPEAKLLAGAAVERSLASAPGRSFASAPYPLAPNSPLFPYAQKALRGEFTATDLAQLRLQTGVRRVYIALHAYSKNIRQAVFAAEHFSARSLSVPAGVRVFVL